MPQIGQLEPMNRMPEEAIAEPVPLLKRTTNSRAESGHLVIANFGRRVGTLKDLESHVAIHAA